MIPRATSLLTRLLASGMLATVIALAVPALTGMAQEPTPSAINETGTPVETPPSTITPTPTPTFTPTQTPTPTPTLTELQARLVLAQAYLEGGDYASAAGLFAAIALEDRGNVEALAGLNAALAGQAAATATAAAPPPTAAPTATPAPPPGVTFGGTFSKQFRDFTGTTLAGLLLILLVYVFAQIVRWLWITGRELWWTRGMQRLRGKEVKPGFLMGAFVDASDTGIKDFPGPEVVAQALTERLLRLNESVQPELQTPVKPDTLELGGMAWIKVLWNWILPPPRAYKVGGVLMGSKADGFQLSVERVSLAHNKVDASRTFEPEGGAGGPPDQVFRALATTAADWLRDPIGMQPTAVAIRGMPAAREAAPVSPTTIVNQVLELLIPVRQQVKYGIKDRDFVVIRHRLNEAEKLLDSLPESSSLRRDLQSSIDDLRKGVQPGAPG